MKINLNILLFVSIAILYESCEQITYVKLSDLKKIVSTRDSIFTLNGIPYTGNVEQTQDKIKIKSFQLVDGKINGVYKEFFTNGNPKKVIGYAKGVLDGYYEIYYRNGNLKEKQLYESGLINGTRKTFWQNGLTKEINNFKMGLLVGKTSIFFSNGNLRKVIEFNDSGMRHGVWLDFDQKNNLISKTTYRNGKKIKNEVFD